MVRMPETDLNVFRVLRLRQREFETDHGKDEKDSYL